jgi:hypothetical protein
MTDPLDELPSRKAVAAPHRLQRDTAHLLSQLTDIAGAVRGILADYEAGPVATMKPEERAQQVALYWMLRALESPVKIRREAIEHAFKMAFAELGGDQLKLPGGGTVRYEAARPTITVRADSLRRELRKLVPTGAVSEADIEGAFKVVTTVEADNRKLNALHKHGGTAVAEVIDAHRTRTPPSILQGKVRFPQPEDGS